MTSTSYLDRESPDPNSSSAQLRAEGPGRNLGQHKNICKFNLWFADIIQRVNIMNHVIGKAETVLRESINSVPTWKVL